MMELVNVTFNCHYNWQ